MTETTTATDEARIDVHVSDHVGWLVVNNPVERNAVSMDMWHQFPAAVRKLDEDPEVRVIVLRGAGKSAFIAGSNIAEFEAVCADRNLIHLFSTHSTAATEAFRKATKPTIAMIRGFCLGGGMALAMSCDMRVATASCQFGSPAARLGTGYPLQCVRDLVTLVGPARAKDMLFTAREVGAEEALRIGLIDRCVADTELDDEIAKLCRTLAINAPMPIRATKAAINAVTNREEDTRYVSDLISACFDSQDFVEGRTAFIEKRLPAFTNE